MSRTNCINCISSEFDENKFLRCHLNPPQSINWTEEDWSYGERKIYFYQEFQFPIVKENDWCNYGIQKVIL